MTLARAASAPYIPRMAEPTSKAKCPICGKPAAEGRRPFCSKRCADVDLNRWLSGAYVIPGKVEDEADETSSAPLQPDDPE